MRKVLVGATLIDATTVLVLTLILVCIGTSISANEYKLASVDTTKVGQAIDNYNGGHWVDDPNQAGSSLPAEGRSLFDFIMVEEKNGNPTYNIPFPYSRLIEKIETFIQPESGSYPGIKQVLIPLGRSLARNVARPDFFRFPRVVSVIDSEPVEIERLGAVMLKDRLYIGYGEAAEILEIISYNEAAGRFEFQIVTDYRPGGTPKVFYANREVCSACHQNEALIFSRQQWDETNANPRIATLLNQQKRDFYGVAVNRGVDIPFAIDAATDRANLFSFYQLLWQKGCQKHDEGPIKTSNYSIECRRNLLTYSLQYLLSSQTLFDSQTEYYQNTFLQKLRSNWKKHWPEGLLISDPDIPNRDPLLLSANTVAKSDISGKFSSDATTVLNTMLARNDVPEEFEPLNYRSPLSHWKVDADGIDKALIAGLAGFIPATDIKELDKHLVSSASGNTRKTPFSCTVDVKPSERKTQQIKFDCHSEGTSSVDAIALKGRFVLEGNNLNNGKLSRLKAGNQMQFDLILNEIKIEKQNNRVVARLGIRTTDHQDSSSIPSSPSSLTARLPNGNSIEYFELRWKIPNPKKLATDIKSTGELSVRNDFDLVKESITKVAQLTANNESDALSNKPFRRASVMKLLFAALGLPKTDWCCLDTRNLPKAELQDPENQTVIVSQSANADTAPFYHYCSVCHRTSNKQPPNFLQGNEQQVGENISQCAERIFFRLSMWQINGSNKPKSPMPPATALHNLGFTQQRWMSSDELASLKHTVSKLIVKGTGQEPDIENYIKTGFDNLPACLP